MITIYQCKSIYSFPFNILPFLIRFFQGRIDYTHYAMSETREYGEIFYDSTLLGVRTMSASEFSRHYDIVRGFRVPHDFNKLDVEMFFYSHLGKRYSIAQLFGLLLKVWKVVSKNPFGKGAKRIICNEFVILFFNRFYKTNIKDTDSFDLNDTEDLIISQIGNGK